MRSPRQRAAAIGEGYRRQAPRAPRPTPGERTPGPGLDCWRRDGDSPYLTGSPLSAIIWTPAALLALPLAIRGDVDWVAYLPGAIHAFKPACQAIGPLQCNLRPWSSKAVTPVAGCGSLLFAAPHFLVGPYRGATHTRGTCSAVNSTMPPSAVSTHPDLAEALFELKNFLQLHVT